MKVMKRASWRMTVMVADLVELTHHGNLRYPDAFWSSSILMECLLHRFTSLFQPRTHRAGIGDSICDNCIDNICFFGNDMYILSDIAHMLKIHQVRKAVFARSAGPVPISGPVKDRLRPVPDRSLTPYVFWQSDQISMLKMIQQSSFTGLSTIQELPAHIEYYKSCKMSLIYFQYSENVLKFG